MAEMKIIGKTRGEKITDVVIYLLMIALCIICVYPLLFTVFAAFSDAKRLMNRTGLLFAPLMPMTLQGFKLTFSNAKLVVSIGNTLIYVLGGTLLGLSITALAAFVLSRKNFLIRGAIMKFITFTMFFNGGIIPLFFVVKNIGIYNTRWAFILPWAMSAYNMIIMRTFFMGIPDALEEAALLDGASDLQIFARVYIPLSTAVIAVIAMYYGVGWWNSWYQSLILQPDNKLWPMQMILRETLISNQTVSSQAGQAMDVTMMAEESYTRELVKYCTVVVATVPILVIYPFLQKYFVKGVMLGAVKG